MARISKYESDSNIALSDTLLGSDNDANKTTKNYSISNIKNFLGGYFLSKMPFYGNVTFHYPEPSEGGANATYGANNQAQGLIRAVKTHEYANNTGVGTYNIQGAEHGGTVLIQNETAGYSTVLALKASRGDATTNHGTILGVSAKYNTTNFSGTNIATGKGGSHFLALKLQGNGDLRCYGKLTTNGFMYNASNTTYYINLNGDTQLNQLQVNRITPKNSNQLTTASSIFCIPKVSGTEQNAFNANNTQAGMLGQMLFDDNYIYICTAAGSPGSATWKRVAISSW